MSEIQKFKNYENMIKDLETSQKETKERKEKKSKGKKEKDKKASKSRQRKGMYSKLLLVNQSEEKVGEQKPAENEIQTSIKLSNLKDIKMLGII